MLFLSKECEANGKKVRNVDVREKVCAAESMMEMRRERAGLIRSQGDGVCGA